jgi:hypothetical protein
MKTDSLGFDRSMLRRDLKICIDRIGSDMQSFSKTATIAFEDEQKRAASACFLGGGRRRVLIAIPIRFLEC